MRLFVFKNLLASLLPWHKPANSRAFLNSWIATQPIWRRIIVTVDSATGEMMSLEAVAPNNMPAVLRIALARNEHIAWQVRGPHHLHRAKFEPATMLDVKQQELSGLQNLVSARLIALEEMTRLDYKISSELEKLGAICPDT